MAAGSSHRWRMPWPLPRTDVRGSSEAGRARAAHIARSANLRIVALELLTGKQDDPSEIDDVNVALVPLGTPLLAGPGTIVATIVFVQQHHATGARVAIAAGIVAVHLLVFLSLFFSVFITKLIRESGIVLLTRIAVELLSAIAVQLIANSVMGFVEAGSTG